LMDDTNWFLYFQLSLTNINYELFNNHETITKKVIKET